MAPTHTWAPRSQATQICKSLQDICHIPTLTCHSFHLYGPHGPTLLSNGPSSVEIQGRWIKDAIKFANRAGYKYINPTEEAQKAWKQRINELGDATLFPTTRSTYMGGTVPGKKVEMVCSEDDIPSMETMLTRSPTDMLRRRCRSLQRRDPQQAARMAGL